MAMIKKTIPSCARVKVQVDLLANLPKVVEMEVVNVETRTSRVEKIRIQYAMVPKYCKQCKLQGARMLRVLHPELRARKQEVGHEDNEKSVENLQPEAALIKVGE
ncbi:hypothetical protein KY285_036115 [Solanum tuberosum]|nr:hypothetical protein KY289_036276 [Solanum tuberosum]KAH0639529.1 hypothetical protein KY285_036115 [Solanum tuberosum]